jgi:alpha-beta hydrolase superfamily lysophospholipase
MRLNELNEVAEEHAPRATRYRAALISLHGMSTTGKWQKDLTPDVFDRGIRYMPLDYGFAVIGVLCRRRRQKIIRDILRAYREQRQHSRRLAVVAHSFGSLTLMQAILERKGLRFARVVLFGCIVHRRYPWSQVTSRIDRVLHERSRSDLLPLIAPIFIPNSGASGCIGFKNTPSFVEERVYKGTRHSKLQFRRHYRDVWIPFILS